MMMVREKRDMRPLFLNFGVALALSFAGFLYSRFRTTRIRPTQPPPSSSSSGESNKVDSGGRAGLNDELCALQTIPSSCHDAWVAAQNYEETSHQVTIDNSIVGLSPSSKHSGDEEGFLLPEFNELVFKEFDLIATHTGICPEKDVETATVFRRTDMDEEQEIINLKNMERILHEREMNLEFQLLEYYGLKEQETAVIELQNRLKINNMEAKLFTLKIKSLNADNRRLEAQVADYARVMAELESARAEIKVLKMKIRSDLEQKKEQLSTLQQSVANLQDQEQRASSCNADVQTKLHRIKNLEDESEELRRDNLRLQHENYELARRLESTQILASVLDDPEAEALQQVKHHLRQENEDLAKKIEQLQEDRCTDAEELVYLRWVNACLRYELRNYQPPPGKTFARDLSKTLSPKSEEKAKQLILEYANTEGMGEKGINLDFDSDWSSSQASNFTESGELDDSSFATSATRTNSSSKMKIFSKFKRLVTGKEGHGRRESMSTTSFEDMVGTFSCENLPSHLNASISATPLTAIARTDGQRNKIITPSQSSYKPSLDIQRIRSPNLEDIRDMESIRRNSDAGSSYGYKRIVFGEAGVVDLSQDNGLDHDPEAHEKLELMKFAEVLKGSRKTRNSHRKSVSFRSY
ncbi:hypothetical protein HHK36_014213 [Tetracentron sinense]|uniref:Uncharacterized protein n=1 Tax=Tetracentron sinense TaxID=13715 RepID=A0A834Z5N6_TETSI|nr:hypothetical protein HHK36_014213 [Tetracentron sinense]